MVWCQHLHYSIYSTVNYGIIWFKKEISTTYLYMTSFQHPPNMAPLPLEKIYLNDDLESFDRSRLVVVWAPLHFWHLFGRSKFSWYSYEKIGPYGITFSLYNYNSTSYNNNNSCKRSNHRVMHVIINLLSIGFYLDAGSSF